MQINFLLPTTDVYGGIRSVLEIGNVLENRGHSVRLIIPAIKMLPKDDPLESLRKILSYSQKRRASSEIDWFDFAGQIITIPHILVTKFVPEHWIPDADATIATWWKSAYYVNSYPPSTGEKFYFIQHFETHAGNTTAVRKTYQLPLQQIVTSTSLKEKIEEISGDVAGQIIYGVDFETFYKEDTGYEVEEPIRIGMMYSNREWKGNEEGFQAFEQVRSESDKELQIVLFGRESDDSIPSHSEFYEDPEQDRLRQIYNSMDIFVMPSHHEGFGMPPMEAMACGTACVVTNVGGVPDYMLPGKTGKVVRPKDVSDLSNALQELVSDTRQIERLAENGHNHIQQFTWRRCGKQFESILQNGI